MAVVFDGERFAAEREALVAKKVAGLSRAPKLGSVYFAQDESGLVYTRLKSEEAERVGVRFDKLRVFFEDEVAEVAEKVGEFCAREGMDGVLVQKPSRQSWQRFVIGGKQLVSGKPKGKGGLVDWWERVVSRLDPKKDVDCLTRVNLDRVYAGEWEILPATVKAVALILLEAGGEIGEGKTVVLGAGSVYNDSNYCRGEEGGFGERRELVLKLERVVGGKKCVVVGRSELVGRPLAAVLAQAGAKVGLYGSDLDLSELAKADLVVSATGRRNLIKVGMLKKGVVVIDVGEPMGDVEFGCVAQKAAFVTPVPGGVGPVTVVSLLENLVGMVG